MRTVGVRELKNRLSAYLRDVQSGEGVLVTDRGKVVAELTPPDSDPTHSDVPPGLLALAKRGLVTLASGAGDRSLYPKLSRPGHRDPTSEHPNVLSCFDNTGT